jgi:hypothetical protein
VLLPELKIAPHLQQLLKRQGVEITGELAVVSRHGPADELDGWLTMPGLKIVLNPGKLSA